MSPCPSLTKHNYIINSGYELLAICLPRVYRVFFVVLMVWRKPRAVSSASDPSVPLTAQVPRPEVLAKCAKIFFCEIKNKWNQKSKMMEDELWTCLWTCADFSAKDMTLGCSAQRFFVEAPTIQTAKLQRIIAGALCLGRRCVSLLLIQNHKLYRLRTDVVQICIVSHSIACSYTTASLKYAEGAHWPWRICRENDMSGVL